MLELRKDLKEKYDSQYSDATDEWRRVGAEGKIRNIVDITKNHTFNSIIEIGAGDGSILELMVKNNLASKFTALEISDSAIEQIKKKNIPGLVEIRQFDGYNLPFEDNSFDLAVCTHVIEHVEFPRKLLREIKRISTRQLFEIPIDFSFRVDRKFEHFNSYGHINIYTPALFNFLLLTEGFVLTKSLSRLYPIGVLRYQYKSRTLTYLLLIIKRIIWKMVPWLLRIKPNTFTVLTE